MADSLTGFKKWKKSKKGFSGISINDPWIQNSFNYIIRISWRQLVKITPRIDDLEQQIKQLNHHYYILPFDIKNYQTSWTEHFYFNGFDGIYKHLSWWIFQMQTDQKFLYTLQMMSVPGIQYLRIGYIWFTKICLLYLLQWFTARYRWLLRQKDTSPLFFCEVRKENHLCMVCFEKTSAVWNENWTASLIYWKGLSIYYLALKPIHFCKCRLEDIGKYLTGHGDFCLEFTRDHQFKIFCQYDAWQ